MSGRGSSATIAVLRGGVLVVLAAAAAVVLTVGVLSFVAEPADGLRYPTLQSDRRQPVAVVIGGSIAEGAGSSGTGTSWPFLVTRSRGWSTVLLTGDDWDVFALTPRCRACADGGAVLASAVDLRPRVVVVVGQAEPRADDTVVAAAASALIAGLRTELPRATIVVTGPPGGDAASVAALEATLRASAARVGGVYVAFRPSDLPRRSLSADGSTLTDAGQRAFARRIGQTLG